MSTQTTDHAVSDEVIPGFRLRWRGYDCDEVDRFLKEIAADRRRLDDAFARLDTLIASKQDGRADEVVAMAHRQADEIRAAAEQEARRILRDATSQGEYLQCERLKASRREIERLATVRKDIEGCLETAIGALTRARGSSILDPGDTSAIVAPAEPAQSTNQTRAAGDETTQGRSRLMWTALVLWTALLAAIVVMLRMPPERPSAAESVTATSPVERIMQQAEPIAQVTPAMSASTTPNVSVPELSRLTVTIIATRECWISTVVDDGAPRERLLRPSEKLVLNAADVVVLKAGNAAALSVLVNDQRTAPLGGEGQVVTRRITRANFRTLLAPELSRG